MTPVPHRVEQLISRVTLWLLVLFSGVAILALLLLIPHGGAVTNALRLVTPASIIAACGVAFVLARRGRARLGAIIAIATAFVMMVAYVVGGRFGLHSYTVSVFAVLIIATSLLVSPVAGVGASVVALVTSFALYAVERAGLMTDAAAVAAIPLINILVVYCILFGATGAMLYVFARAFNTTLGAAAEQEARLRTLIEMSPVGYVMHRDDRVLMMNRVAAEPFGGASRRVGAGDDIYDFVPADQHGYARERMAAARAAGAGVVVPAEYRIPDGQGRERTVETLTATVVLADGPALLTVIRDVTREREAREVLASAKAQAETASRAKSQFLANMSHEIRTPMNAVIGLSELLLASPLSAEQQRRASGIRSSAQALLRVINDILDVSRIEAGRMELIEARFEPRRLVEQVRDLLSPLAAEKSLALVLDVGAGVPVSALADEGRLRQILVNLTANAIKFTERGSVRVSVDANETAAGDARLRFRVADTGIGMTGEQLGALFAPFVQLDASSTRRHGGTGLGLYIAHQFAQLMGGTLRASSAPGAGSTFELDLPLREGSQVPVAPVPANAWPVPAGVPDGPGSGAGTAPAAACAPVPQSVREAVDRGRPGGALDVLVVEDNGVNQEVARGMLEEAGHRVVVADDGAQALSQCESRHFDCVLMDCQMPVMDGFEATRRIRQRERESGARRMRIVALTANAMAGDRERCLQAGMDDFLGKPFDTAALLAVVSARAPAGEPGEAGSLEFDPVGLDALARIERSKPGFIAGLVDQYLESAPQLIAQVVAAAPANARDAERAAHSLKSSSARVGAAELSGIAARAQASLRDGEFDEAHRLAADMLGALERTRARLVAHARALGAGG